jgi:hypothetical protein
MKKRHQTKKYPPSAVKKIASVHEPLKIGKVKRIGFYISDETTPNGKQRKVIALNTFYLDALRHIGVKNVSEWIGVAVDKHCALNGKIDAWIRIVEFCIVQELITNGAKTQ